MRHSTLRMTFALVACLLAGTASAASSGKWTQKVEAGKDLYATFKTSEGDIVVRLFPKEAPKTVANFVGLATGEKEWTDPTSGKKSKKPLYAGTVFHRVIPNFMIQGGDPTGTGMGDPGYRFEDEFQSGRTFDKPGLLAMANAGPNTNGSQFFITTSTPAHLTGRHTIFGEVVKGYEVVEKISNLPTDNRDRPRTAVVINQVVLSDKAPAGVAAAGAKPGDKGKAPAAPAPKKDTGAKAPAAPKQ
ncbi:peptidylprolyl isomerase [Pyxidicoccus fallax]|uniref:Peptidyl-prolyl cis-trans isomerase n=1 Tax=Pyxidicoccus fallax TaxID=394095 RepID=A0A848L5Q9_9BACT|nr:peptidylprolyl isomerase [Pyxidicoccus fallax]NMO13612.1 peptidylprolyl isomerase [Pyxidicoccus fallax]NPC77756.1 peptidylprolyl isomerase [Pyxidicoccus fallax]